MLHANPCESSNHFHTAHGTGGNFDARHFKFPSAIEDYKLLRILGKGAFGQVYEACIKRDSAKKFAIKLIDKKLMRNENMVQRVRDEVTIHYQLRHPSIVELHHFFEDSQFVYLVTELCGKGELFQYMQRSRGRVLSETEAKSFFREIIKGLAYMHAHGIIHRDLKLSNILLTDDSKPKIADFGLAVRQNVPASSEQKTICGTPNYLAPEIILKQPYGMAADIWSLGCLLYTFLVGRPPFESANIKNTFSRLSRADYEIPSTLSPSAKDLLKRMITLNPKDRISLEQILCHPFLCSTNNAKVPLDTPFNTLKLKPIRQQTKQGIIEIKFDGSVIVETLVDNVEATVQISRNGIDVVHVNTGRQFKFPILPASLLRIYEYARRFISLLRSKSPLIIIMTEKFKAYLMGSELGNGTGDFHIRYLEPGGPKLEYRSVSDELLVSIGTKEEPGRRLFKFHNPNIKMIELIEPMLVRLLVLEFLGRYRQALEVSRKLMTIEGERSNDFENGAVSFPFVIREGQWGGSNTNSKLENYKVADNLQTNQSVSNNIPNHAQMSTLIDLASTTLKTNLTMTRAGGNNRTGQLIRINQEGKTIEASFACATFRIYLPNVGWCLTSGADQFLLLFTDGQALLIDGQTNSVGFHDPITLVTKWFVIDQTLPSFAKEKLGHFPKFVELIKQGRAHSFLVN